MIATTDVTLTRINENCIEVTVIRCHKMAFPKWHFQTLPLSFEVSKVHRYLLTNFRLSCRHILKIAKKNLN